MNPLIEQYKDDIPSLRKAINKLHDWADGDTPEHIDKGICWALDGTIELPNSLVINFCIKYAVDDYKYYSGSPIVPVSHPTRKASAAYSHTSNMWFGEYGRRRRELCRVMADKLTELLVREGL